MVGQKFTVGDRVIAKGDPQEEVHEVLGFSYDENGFTYKVTSKEVDVAKKEIVEGVSFYKEGEIKKEKKE